MNFVCVVGALKLRVSDSNLDLSVSLFCRYLLKPRRNINEKGELGSLRLRIHYSSVYVFDSLIYEPLRKLILESHEIKVSHTYSRNVLSFIGIVLI